MRLVFATTQSGLHKNSFRARLHALAASFQHFPQLGRISAVGRHARIALSISYGDRRPLQNLKWPLSFLFDNLQLRTEEFSERYNEFYFLLSAIPHFKEVVIMATNCDYCGHKTNEVKSGGGIEPKGTKITLQITDPSDLSRDVLKVSEKTVMLDCMPFKGHLILPLIRFPGTWPPVLQN